MDLITKAFQVLQYAAHADENVDVLLNIENVTDHLIEGVTVKLYLSHNSWISTGDYEIGSYDIHSIASNAQSGVTSANLHFPTADHEFWLDKGNGTYYIGALIANYNAIDLVSQDAYQQFVTHDAIDITELYIPGDPPIDRGENYIDLVGSYFNATPADGDHRLSPGESLNIDYKIANQEDRHAEAFNVEFYLSSNSYISKNDLLIGTHQIESVNGLSSTDILNGTFQLPDANNEIWSHLDGTYYIGMMIDRAHQVPEFSHLNNQNQGQYLDSDTVKVVGTNIHKEADLISAGLQVISDHSRLKPGDLFQVQYDVLNAGSGDAPFFANNFYLATEEFVNSHQQINDGDIDFHNLYGLLGDRDSFLIQLGPYEHAGTQDVILQVPYNVAAGEYYLVMQTDDYDEVPETNEYNNIDYVKIDIEGSGDLFNQHLDILDDVSEDKPLKPGEIFTAEYEVVNQGGEDIPFSATHFYLLTEDYLNEHQTIQVEDINNLDLFALYGDFYTEVITLEAGESTGKREISLEVPHNIEPGKYFLGIHSDVFEEVDEPNELNNSLFAPVGDYVELYIADEIGDI